MMDNPISWGIMVILAICFAIWFAWKCEQELSQNQRDNDDFFWEYDHKTWRK